MGTSSLIYSTYLGGSTVPTMGTGKDEAEAIVVDSTGEAIVTGTASSSDFPVKNAFDATYNGGIGDVFVSKLNATGSGLVFSTLLGTDGVDSGMGIALDPSGNIYITGLTNWYSFPTTPGAWQSDWNANQCGSVNNDPCPDAFVTKLSVTGAMVYSTYLGGALPDYGYAIAVDSAGDAYVAGHTISFNFPLVNPLPGVSTGANDAFVAKMNPTGSGILFSTLIGGGLTDEAKSIALSGSNVLLVGTTIATDFPIVSPYESTNSGGTDAFIAKFPMPGASATLNAISVSPSSVVGGASSSGTVTLNSAAPSTGALVALTSSNTAVATVPASVTVAAGATTARFAIGTKAVTASATSTITASFAGVAKTATVTATPAPAAFSTLAVSPTTLVGSHNATGTVTLTKAAPAAGAVVTLTSSNTAGATVPASVTVAAGATSATFTIASKVVGANTAVTISAAYGGATKTAALTVMPALSAVVVSPASVVGGLNASGACRWPRQLGA